MSNLNLETLKKAQANVAAKLAKQAQADAQEAASREENKSTENEPVEVNKTVKTVTATEATKPEKVTVLPGPVATVEETATGKAAKAKNDNRQIQFVATAQDLLKKEKITFGECRTDKNKVIAGDLIVYHVNSEFLQVWQVEHISKAGTLTLELYSRHDSLGQNKGTAGAWTTENWKINGLKNVFASKASSREKFLRIAIFASK